MNKGVPQAASIALACAVALVATDSLTRSRIEQNVAQREHEQLAAIAGGKLPSTLPSTTPMWRRGIWELGDGRLILRRSIEGYGGPIELFIAVEQTSVRILGLRVIAHQETPGIADFLSRPDQGWLAGRHGLGVMELETTDGVSGATITSRAVTRALTAALCAAATTLLASVPTLSPATDPPTSLATDPATSLATDPAASLATEPAAAPCATATSRDVRR